MIIGNGDRVRRHSIGFFKEPDLTGFLARVGFEGEGALFMIFGSRGLCVR